MQPQRKYRAQQEPQQLHYMPQGTHTQILQQGQPYIPMNPQQGAPVVYLQQMPHMPQVAHQRMVIDQETPGFLTLLRKGVWRVVTKSGMILLCLVTGTAIFTLVYDANPNVQAWTEKTAPQVMPTIQKATETATAALPASAQQVVEKVVEKVVVKEVPTSQTSDATASKGLPIPEKEQPKEDTSSKDKKGAKSESKPLDMPDIPASPGGLVAKQNPPITPISPSTASTKIDDIQNGPASEPKDAVTTYTADSSIVNTDIVSAEAIDRLFDVPGGQLKGEGKVVRAAALSRGIEPGFLAMILYHESNKGTSPAIKKYNNPAGVMCMVRAQGVYDGCKGNDPTNKNGTAFTRFNFLEEGIFEVAQVLRVNYINFGQNTIQKIGVAYAPKDAKNQVGNENSSWIPDVVAFMNKLMDAEQEIRDEKAKK